MSICRGWRGGEPLAGRTINESPFDLARCLPTITPTPRTAPRRRPRPVERPRPREVRVFRGVHLDAVRPGIAGRLHGADEPDDVQLTLAGQFALRPSMFQEVGIDEGAVRSIARRPCRPPSASASPPPRRAGAATDPADRRRTQGLTTPSRRRIRSPQASARCCAAPPASRPGWSPPHVSAQDPRCADRFRRTR